MIWQELRRDDGEATRSGAGITVCIGCECHLCLGHGCPLVGIAQGRWIPSRRTHRNILSRPSGPLRQCGQVPRYTIISWMEFRLFNDRLCSVRERRIWGHYQACSMLLLSEAKKWFYWEARVMHMSDGQRNMLFDLEIYYFFRWFYRWLRGIPALHQSAVSKSLLLIAPLLLVIFTILTVPLIIDIFMHWIYRCW